MANINNSIQSGVELMRHHSHRQVQHARQKQLRREKKRRTISVNEIDFSDVYIPPPYSPHKPHTYGTQAQMTVVRKGTTIGVEAAF